MTNLTNQHFRSPLPKIQLKPPSFQNCFTETFTTPQRPQFKCPLPKLNKHFARLQLLCGHSCANFDHLKLTFDCRWVRNFFFFLELRPSGLGVREF